MQCRRCCENSCHSTGFLYKRFASGFTESDAAEVTLPPDDAGWPTTAGGCWQPRPYSNLYGTSTGGWHIGGRVYTSGAGFSYDAGFGPDLSMYGLTGQYRYLDDSERLFWLAVRPISGFWQQLEVYRYDPALGVPTSASAHELVYTQGGPGSYLPSQNSPLVRNSVRLGDISADGTKFLYASAANAGANESYVDLIMVDLTTGKVLWRRNIEEPTIFHEDAAETEDGGWWPTSEGAADRNTWFRTFPLMLRIGPDGDAYVTVRPFVNQWGLPSDLFPGFWRLDGETGHLKGGYGRYAGPLVLGDLTADYVERAKISIFNHFDVDTDGSVVLCLLSKTHGIGVARITPTVDPDEEINTGDTDPDVCVAKGYEESWVVGDEETYQLGAGVNTIPDNIVCDGSSGAYFSYLGCLRYSDGSAFVTWSKKWGQYKNTSSGLVDPDWMRRSPATGAIHTSSPGGFYDEPDPERECDSATPEPDGVETSCCPNVPLTLPVRRRGLFPGSGTITYGATSGPGGGPAWTGTITGSNCEQAIGLACMEVSESVYDWFLSIAGSTWRRINQTATCSPFSLVVPLDPWEYIEGTPVTSFVLACTTLIIGNDDGTIDDVGTIDLTLTFTPFGGSQPDIVYTATLPQTSCNVFSKTEVVSPCPSPPSRTIQSTLTFLDATTVQLVVIVDGIEFFNATASYSCDPISIAWTPAGKAFCGFTGTASYVAAETP